MTEPLLEAGYTIPATFAGTALVLVLSALAASLVPVWRASRVDPLGTLRAD